jgi:hypothetical protein
LIPVEKAEVGMVLEEGVSDRRGRLLMPAGRALEEKHLQALPMWGVTHILVEGVESDPEEEERRDLEPWAMAQAGEELSHVFLHADEQHPVIRALSALRIRRRALEIQREASHA